MTENETLTKDGGTEKYLINSVETALSILDMFFDYSDVSVQEAGKALGISRSTAYRFFVTLESKGYLIKRDNSKYALGVKLFSLGQRVSTRADLIAAIHPFLVRLSGDTGESTNLVVMDGATHVTYIDKVLSNCRLKMDTPVGFYEMAHLTAAGKALLACSSDSLVTQYIRAASFPRRTASSIRDAKQLLEELDTICVNGYAVDDQENECGLICYAVPIVNSLNQPIAALSQAGPSIRMQIKRERCVELLKDAAERINKMFM